MLLNSLAIIPARGGSKRIPRKSIIDFLGKPIISYPIKAAIASNCFDEVMVSTDDQEIATLAKAYGAVVPFVRSAITSNDTATTLEVLIEVLNNYSKLGRRFEQICCIYPTAVFITAENLQEARKMLQTTKVDGVATFVRSDHQIERAFEYESDYISPKSPKYIQTRTQDLPPSYFDAGQMYFIKVAALESEDAIFVSRMKPLLLNRNFAQDIDTQEDLDLAKLKYQLQKF